MDTRAVEQAMRDVADAEIRPRFRALAEGDISTKSGPHDFVTVADTAAERALTILLRDIRDIPVVGEEASAADPLLEGTLADVPAAWVVDPVDGTANFVKGSPTYAVMVALVENGAATAGWILHPETGDMFAAQAGQGATLNGERLAPTAPRDGDLQGLRAALAVTYAPREMAEGFERVANTMQSSGVTRMCAGFDYADLATGALDVMMFFRTKAWDHAPGAVIVRECGFAVRRLDGSDYLPAVPGEPLLIAPEQVWGEVRDRLVAAVAQ
ncbi:MAG: inositol monophosphatase [Actinobacteria bacterium HGW-Actinobacteria-4]|nr:MAG: inositol monophosphatase [Actinobacteria bacterium HGW-Actinobacteria-4]